MVSMPSPEKRDEMKAKVEEQMAKVLSYVKAGAVKLQQDMDRVEFLQKAEETLRVPKLALVGAVVLLALSLFMFNAGAQFIVNVVGFVFPAYESFRAIEEGSDLGKIWLAYWVAFAFINLMDVFADFITYWVPFYYLLKLAAVVYLQSPKTRGAVHLKDVVLKVGKVIAAKFE